MVERRGVKGAIKKRETAKERHIWPPPLSRTSKMILESERELAFWKPYAFFFFFFFFFFIYIYIFMYI